VQHGLEIGVRFISLASGAAGTGAKVFKDRVDVAIEAIGRYDRGRGTHTLTHTIGRAETRPRLQGGS
jgi:hypothetical protein